MKNLRENIDLISLFKHDQKTKSTKYELVSEELGPNFDSYMSYELKISEKELISSLIDDKLIEKIRDFLFRGSVKIEEDWLSSKKYYFINSNKSEIDITNLYKYLETQDSIIASKFINDIFSYTIKIDQNANEFLEDSYLSELISVLNYLEYIYRKDREKNVETIISEFKSIISPDNEENYDSSQYRFDTLCEILKEKGYKIQVNGVDYFDFSQVELKGFAYSRIRSSIVEKDGSTGNVSWQSRRDFINNDMNFSSNHQILSKEVITELTEINFTDVNDNNLDQTLCDIINYIENKLKANKNFIDLSKSESFSSKLIASKLLSQEMIISYRTSLQCFRHHTEEDIDKREELSVTEKRVLVAYGHSICILIKDIKK